MTPRCLIRCVLAFVLVAALLGCEARGRAERVSPHRMAPQPVEAVELYLDGREPDRPYLVLARLESEASTRRFVTLREAEAAALDKLRSLAARYGARAVIDIDQTTTMDQQHGEQVVRMTGKAVAFRR